MSMGLAWKSAGKSNGKLVNQKYATLFLSWMPFNCLNTLDEPIQYQTYTTPKLTPYQHSKHDNKSINLILSLRYFSTILQSRSLCFSRDTYLFQFVHLNIQKIPYQLWGTWRTALILSLVLESLGHGQHGICKKMVAKQFW